MKLDVTQHIRLRPATKGQAEYLEVRHPVPHPKWEEAMKARVPAKQRTWDDRDQVWRFDASHTDLLKSLAVEFFEAAFYYQGHLVTDLNAGQTQITLPI